MVYKCLCGGWRSFFILALFGRVAPGSLLMFQLSSHPLHSLASSSLFTPPTSACCSLLIPCALCSLLLPVFAAPYSSRALSEIFCFVKIHSLLAALSLSLLVVVLLILCLSAATLLTSVKSCILLPLTGTAHGVAILRSDGQTGRCFLISHTYNCEQRTNFLSLCACIIKFSLCVFPCILLHLRTLSVAREGARERKYIYIYIYIYILFLDNT